MATTKKKPLKDFIPLIVVVIIFGLVTYPQMVRSYFPQWEPKTQVVEKEKVVEKIVKQTPTVSVDTIRVNVTSITDGDTCRATLCLPLNVTLVDQRVRCLGYDAYELSEVNGLAAKEGLASLLDGGDVFGMTDRRPFDDFGRVLLHLYVRKNDKIIDVATWMKEHQFVKPPKEKVEDVPTN